VNALGFLSRQEVKTLLAESMAGIVTFLPVPNHIDAQPNKMFEYMSAGLPVIGSHFPLWKEIIEGNNCGICVDPNQPEEIGKAIQYIFDHPKEAENMGINGIKAIEEKYNWRAEEQKLISTYQSILKK
jgi:glycosyltransferase involved in cell wall biosynthesis